VAIDRIRARLLSDHILRSDGFCEGVNNDRSPSEELLESVLLKARDSFEEKKVRHLGLFYANLVFAAHVSPQTAHQLLKLYDRLTYRQLCLIALVGERGTVDVEALRRPDHLDPDIESLKREEMELHSTDIGTIGLTCLAFEVKGPIRAMFRPLTIAWTFENCLTIVILLWLKDRECFCSFSNAHET
jgi:hypothetical protein